MTRITPGMIATATSRLEKPSGVPLRFQCVATVGGSCGYAQIEIPTATTAIARPNQRLRMVLLPETSDEVADDLLKDGRVEAVPDELAFALGSDEIGCLEDAEVVRDRRECDGELLGDLPGGQVLLRQELEDLPPGGVGQSAKQGVFHGIDI